MSATPAVAGDFTQIAPAIFAWHAYEPEVKCELSSHAIQSEEGLILIDPIGLSEAALGRLLRGKVPRAILLTNGNHARAAGTFRELFGVKVFAAADANGLGIIPDELLREGQIAPGGMEVIDIPGAGPGEIALTGHGIACIGDALIHLPPEGLRFLPEKYCGDAVQMRRSLRKLLSCEFQLLTFAHGAPLLESARMKLESLLA